MYDYNETWADAQTYVRDTNGEFDTIEVNKSKQPGLVELRLVKRVHCIVYWKGKGPLHFARSEFLRPTGDASRPWYGLKRFVTEGDFIPRVRGKWVPGRIAFDSGKAGAKGNWQTHCQLYHDFLTWRSYWAVAVAFSVFESDRSNWFESKGIERWSGTFTEALSRSSPPPGLSDSIAPDLRTDHQFYCSTEFCKTVLKTWHWMCVYKKDTRMFDYHALWEPER